MDEFSSLRLIGRGSYGEVYLVKSLVDSRQYVLKRIKLDSLSEKERRTAAQEARLLSGLVHPNIVSYKDSFHFNGLLHIVMSYCEGGDLNRFLKARNSSHLSESQIIHWFVQLALALQYLHGQNILHRDLKTQNIFLSRNIIKVGDLGIARVLESPDAMARTFIGTPYYMSPEIFQKMPYNYKSDIWALGCCVVEMATLKTAFSARDLNSLAFKIILGKQPSIPDSYSVHLKQLIQCLLARDPEQRPSINQVLKLSFIRSHIIAFLQERRKNGIQESDKPKDLPLRDGRDTSDVPLTIPNPHSDYGDSNCSLTLISSLQNTSGRDQGSVTSLSSYSTDRCTELDDTVICNESVSPAEFLDLSEPDHLENINSHISNGNTYLKNGPEYSDCNSDVPTSNDTVFLEQIPNDKLKELPLPYPPQLSNISNLQIGNRVTNCSGEEAEVVESEARRRRREQKRQQNSSDALMNRYNRRSAGDVTQQDSESRPDTDPSELNKKISCVRLCNDLLASIDSDEEKMLTLFTSTLRISGEVTNPVDDIRTRDSSSKGEPKPSIESYRCQSLPEDETAVEMLSSIAELETECAQVLGERVFAISKVMLEKYCDDSEELECNVKLILGLVKFELYFPLLLKLKLFKQLHSLNTFS